MYVETHNDNNNNNHDDKGASAFFYFFEECLIIFTGISILEGANDDVFLDYSSWAAWQVWSYSQKPRRRQELLFWRQGKQTGWISYLNSQPCREFGSYILALDPPYWPHTLPISLHDSTISGGNWLWNPENIPFMWSEFNSYPTTILCFLFINWDWMNYRKWSEKIKGHSQINPPV